MEKYFKTFHIKKIHIGLKNRKTKIRNQSSKHISSSLSMIYTQGTKTNLFSNLFIVAMLLRPSLTNHEMLLLSISIYIRTAIPTSRHPILLRDHLLLVTMWPVLKLIAMQLFLLQLYSLSFYLKSITPNQIQNLLLSIIRIVTMCLPLTGIG